ncbi:hypothetical protein CBS470a_013774 [Colletotrichum nupharicola]|nr:hypothetical protein CBS470a_013774 [Colletotrichum nupharicola]
MPAEDKQFEELLAEFEVAHAQRTRSLEAHMNKAKSILESETDGLQQTMNVKHAPISARLKDADKALRTLRRRQEDRKQLRDLKSLVESRGHKWEDYYVRSHEAGKGWIIAKRPFINDEKMHNDQL